MKFGIAPEYKRESINNPAWVKGFAQLAENAGCETLMISEHPIVAEDPAPLYTYADDGKAHWNNNAISFPSPLEWLSYAAAVTSTIKLFTGILLLPLHSPIIVAKRIATLDALSGGRLMLGVGLGWQIEEFDAANVPYNERGKRMDEAIPAIRALWRDSPASFDGQFYKFSKLHCDVKPVQAGGPPIIIGGSSDAAAARAGRIGDGFYPYSVSPEVFADLVAKMRKAAKEAGRNPDDVEISFAPGFWKGHSSLDLDLAKAYAQAGATRFLFNSMEAGSTDLKDIERFIKTYRDKIIAKL